MDADGDDVKKVCYGGCSNFDIGPGGGRCTTCGTWFDDSDGEANVPEWARPKKKARVAIDDLDPLEPMPDLTLITLILRLICMSLLC